MLMVNWPECDASSAALLAEDWYSKSLHTCDLLARKSAFAFFVWLIDLIRYRMLQLSGCMSLLTALTKRFLSLTYAWNQTRSCKARKFSWRSFCYSSRSCIAESCRWCCHEYSTVTRAYQWQGTPLSRLQQPLSSASRSVCDNVVEKAKNFDIVFLCYIPFPTDFLPEVSFLCYFPPSPRFKHAPTLRAMKAFIARPAFFSQHLQCGLHREID